MCVKIHVVRHRSLLSKLHHFCVVANIGDMPVGTCRMRIIAESVDESGVPRAWQLEKLAIRQHYQRRCARAHAHDLPRPDMPLC
jgi:hypothetical protein